MTEEHQSEQASSQSNLARSIFTNTLWGSAGRLFGGVFAFLSSAFLFRALGTEGAGVYATVLAFFYLFNALADGGLYNILLRDIARSPAGPSRLVSTAFTLRLALLVVSMTAGLFLFAAIPQYDGFFALAPAAVAFYLALSFVQLLMAVFQHYLVVSRATRVEIGARAAQLFATAAVFFLDVKSVAPYLLVLFGSAALQFCLLFRSARAYVQVQLKTSIKEAQAMFRESAPVALGLLFTLIYFRLDTVLLSLLKDAHAVGVYSLAYKILEQFIFFPAMFIGVLTPLLSRAVSDPARFQALFSRASSVLAMGAFPILAGGWFLATPLVVLLGGADFAVSADPLRPLLLATLLIFFGTLLGATVIVLGKQRRAIPVYAFGMVVNLTGNFLFIPAYSYIGSAWATVVTEIVIDAGLIAILFGSGLRFGVPRVWRIFGATAAMTLPLLLFSDRATQNMGVWSLLVFSVVCAPIYLGALLAFKAVSREDLRLLRRNNV